MSLLQKCLFGNNVKLFVRAASSFTKASESIYRYQPGHVVDDAERWPKPTAEMKADYENNGFVLIKNILTQVELETLLPAMNLGDRASGKLGKLGKFRQDQKWGLVLWNEQGNDFLGVIAGNSKVAGVAEQLLDRGEIYLYHGKLLRKEAKQGGAADWHQDYASWYQNELLFPDLVAVTISLTQSDRENGGTEVVKGSHHCGRIDHNVTRLQQGADEDRVALVRKGLPTFALDCSPGDGVFMHPNLLRSSGPNPSQHLRCHLKFVYNAKINSPAIKHDYSDSVFTPLNTYPADALGKLSNFDVEEREFKQTEKDRLEDEFTLWDL